MTKMTNKEVFNKACEGLASQGWIVSFDQTGGYCAYRGDDNRKCAVGWLVSDDTYDDDIEGLGVRELSWMHVGQQIFKKNHISSSERSIEFLADLQDLHDNSDNETLKERFRAFAKKRGWEFNY